MYVPQEAPGGVGDPAAASGAVPSKQKHQQPQQPKAVLSVLPANAGDLCFEYTPATASDQHQAAKQQPAENESNRAPSPGGYTSSRTIFVVSVLF